MNVLSFFFPGENFFNFLSCSYRIYPQVTFIMKAVTEKQEYLFIYLLRQRGQTKCPLSLLVITPTDPLNWFV